MPASKELMRSMDKSVNELESATIPTSTSSEQPQQPWSPELVKDLSYSILGFTVIILALCTLLLWKKRANTQDILRIFGIIVIISLSTMLIITGYDKDQIMSVIGLFGAIAGYLLGKDQQRDS